MTTLPATPMDRRAAVAALIAVVLWASAFVGIRDVATTFSPGSIALGRLTVGMLALGLLVLRRGWQPIARRDFVLIVASGITWFAFYNLALNEAERHVDAGTASMLVNTGPIFLGLLAALFLGERMSARLVAGLAVAFGGSVIVGIAMSDAATGVETSVLGVVLCLASAALYAAGVTFQKPALRRVSALQVTWLACFTGWIVCLAFTPALAAELPGASAVSIAWLVYLGLFPTAIGFFVWSYALGRTSAGRLGVTTYLVPPVVVLMAWLLLGEVPPPLAFVGGAVCILGVLVVRSPGLAAWRRRRAEAQADA